MKFFLYILLGIVILLLMVVIHEFGHYIAGKILKFKIDEFSVGFGPKLCVWCRSADTVLLREKIMPTEQR